MRTTICLVLSGFIFLLTSCAPQNLKSPLEMEPSTVRSTFALPSDFASIEPSSVADPTPVPTPPLPSPSPFPAELLGKTYYTPQILCKEISSNDIIQQMLGKPRDIAVSPDGKEIYITFNTHFIENYHNDSYLYLVNRGSKLPFIERTYLYRMKLPDSPAPTVVNMNQDFSLSCGFNGDIEMNADQQLILSFPEIDHLVPPDQWGRSPALEIPIKAHHFYQLNTDSLQIQKFVTRILDPIQRNQFLWGAGTRKLFYLHVDVFTGDLYVYLDDSSKTELIQWTPEKSLFRPLLLFQKNYDFGTPRLPISAKNRHTVIFGPNTYTEPFPQAIQMGLRRQIETTDVNCPKINKKGYVVMTSNPKLDRQGNAFFTGQVFAYDEINPNYDNRSIASFIWKQTPDDQITCIAGNGKNGYLDGKGLEASFKRPMELDLDAAGNIYVADTGNHAIRKITPKGKVSTLYKTPDNVN